MNLSSNAEILCNLNTIVRKMNIYKDNDFKQKIKQIEAIINNTVSDKSDKDIIKKIINNKIDIKKKKQIRKQTEYQSFVKKNMPDIKEQYPAKERRKVISFLWKEWKENKMEIDE
tara:strand:+ start:470 stop:814 length:345 start_codon:yes stop_codon:yes gene_type:complete